MPALRQARASQRVICTLGLLLTLLAAPAAANTLEGRVIKVSDGDTLTLLDDQHRLHRVRLAGIDAPERGQPYARRATEALALLTSKQRISVDGEKIDRYQRRIGIVRVLPADCPDCAPGIDVGLALIGAGMAWHYRSYAREQTAANRTQYQQAETGARARNNGLWAEMEPTPPWDWRRERREAAAARN